MNREDIIRIARSDDWAADVSLKWDDFFVRFATLVAAAEREACARVCDDLGNQLGMGRDPDPDDCAIAIRARGQA